MSTYKKVAAITSALDDSLIKLEQGERLAIQQGLIDGVGVVSVLGFGESGTVTRQVGSGWEAGEELIWDATRVGTPLSVASTSLLDVNPDIGGWSVRVRGIAGTSFDGELTRVTEYADLNGQTPVDLVTPYFIVEDVQLFLRPSDNRPGAGTSRTNQGRIYMGPTAATWIAGKPDAICMIMETLESQSRTVVRGVPTGAQFAAQSFTLTSDNQSAKGLEVDFLVDIFQIGVRLRPVKTFVLSQVNFDVQNSLLFPEGAVIYAQTQTTSGTYDLTVHVNAYELS